MARSPSLHGLDHLQPQVWIAFLAQFPGPERHCVHQGHHVNGGVTPPQQLHFLHRILNGLGIATLECFLKSLGPMAESDGGNKFRSWKRLRG